MEPLIYIIDDHEMFLLGLKSSIEKHFINIQISTFTHPEDLYLSAFENKPDLILADFMLSNGNTGLESILRIRALYQDVRAILISSAKEDRIKSLCQKNNIQGYIYKSEQEKDIIKAIQSVLEGNTYYTEESEIDNIEVIKNYDKTNPFYKLSKIELEVVIHLAKGLSYSEISEVMNISPKTVNNHRVNISEKIGKMSLQHLIMKANIWGVVKDNNLYTNFENKVEEVL